MSWTWRLEAADGTEPNTPAVPEQPSQSDAENWLGEHWRDLAAAGVTRVWLREGDSDVYGPMPLTDR